MNRWLTVGIYAAANLGGALAFVYPLLLPAVVGVELSRLTPLLTFFLLGMCLLALLVETQGEAASGQRVALLALLVAVTATLRFLEVAIPGPAGFSPIFAPIILVGYVFGPRFGFLMGSLTLLTSALITGGVGPWLPYQMMASGWIGMAAGILPRMPNRNAQLAVLLLWGGVTGILYGVLLNLYFWPFISQVNAVPTAFPAPAKVDFRGYLAFYLASSLVWDLARAAGNVLLIWAIGLPVLRVLNRFRAKTIYQIVEATA